MHNVLVVLNFNAGRKRAIKYRKKIQKFLLKKQVSFHFVGIEEFEQTDTKDFDTILVVGGDGTVNKVLRYLVNTNKTLGIIPCGTANLLAARLGINNINKALKIIEKDKAQKIDLIKVNDNLCALRCGFGFDANIISKTPQSLKNQFGYFSYFIAGIIFALRLKNREYSISINGKKRIINASCIIVANAGNMYKNYFSVANYSKLNDGLLDIFILKTQNPILFFIEFLLIMFNFRHNTSIAEYLKADKLTIKNNYFLTHIDGEKHKFTNNIEFEILQLAINIFTN